MAKRGSKKNIAWWKKLVGYPMYAIYYLIKEFLIGIVKLIIMIIKAIVNSGRKNKDSGGKDKKTKAIKAKKADAKSRDDKDITIEDDAPVQPIAGKLKSDHKYERFNIIKNIEGSFDSWENRIYKSDSTIGIIIGARGQGKSAIGMKMLENFKAKTGKNIYALGFKVNSLPNWVNSIENLSNIDEIEKSSILSVDEGGITFGSRDAMSDINKLLSKILMVARHKDLSVIFISQNSSNIDVNAIRQADYIMLKPSSLLQKDLERKIIQKIYKDAEADFKKLGSDPGIVYIYGDKFRGFASNSLPSFWSKDLSKSFDKVK
ncbi:MAG: hypothetical protein ABH879_02700 [archaeon]